MIQILGLRGFSVKRKHIRLTWQLGRFLINNRAGRADLQDAQQISVSYR